MAKTVAGGHISKVVEVNRIPKQVSLPQGKEITMQNQGANTLWFSFDRKTFFSIACGTSFDQRAEFEYIWLRTDVGLKTAYVLATT